MYYWSPSSLPCVQALLFPSLAPSLPNGGPASRLHLRFYREAWLHTTQLWNGVSSLLRRGFVGREGWGDLRMRELHIGLLKRWKPWTSSPFRTFYRPFLSLWTSLIRLTLSLQRSKRTFSQPFKEKCKSEVVRIGSIIIFHLSKLWKAKFFILCDVIFLVRLQGKFEIDHSWEWKG